MDFIVAKVFSYRSIIKFHRCMMLGTTVAVHFFRAYKLNCARYILGNYLIRLNTDTIQFRLKYNVMKKYRKFNNIILYYIIVELVYI